MDDAATDRKRLIDEAIDLVIRLQNDPANPVADEMILAWRARSADHERIWSKVAAVHGATGEVLTTQRHSRQRKEFGVTRRRLMIGGALCLGAAGSGSLIVPELILKSRADYLTAKAEVRNIDLADGSRVTLGPDSALSVSYTQRQRALGLLRGVAFFDVAPDRLRPFTVEARGLVAEALGTAFDVSDDVGSVAVSVEHGSVAISASGTRTLLGSPLGEGEWIALDQASGRLERGTREAALIASWRNERLIVAERDSVRALIARIGRWYPGRIVFADPFIGARQVNGLFDLSDPARALEAVVHPAGGHVRAIGKDLLVITPI